MILWLIFVATLRRDLPSACHDDSLINMADCNEKCKESSERRVMRHGRSRLVCVAAFMLQTASRRGMRNLWQQWTCGRRQHYEELPSRFALFVALPRPAPHFDPLRAPGGGVLEP